MRAALVLVLALLAFGAVSMSEARRIHRMKAALRAEDEAVEAIDIDAAASLPFDDDYWTLGGKAEFAKVLKASAKAKPLNTADLLKKFFSADNILLAQQQKTTARVTVGTYTAVAQKRSCNQGTCEDNWVNIDMGAPAPSATAGATGPVVIACTVPTDLAQAKCDLTLWISGTTSSTSYLTTCTDIGGSTTRSCTTPSYMYQSGSWYGTNFVTDEKDGLDIYVSNTQIVFNWKYHGTSSGKLVFTAIGAVVPVGDFKIAANPAFPPVLAQLSGAAKKTQLNTAAILKQYFSADNILLAQQQKVVAVAELGAYTATAIKRTCDRGFCTTWDKLNLDAPQPSATAASGKVRLACNIPADQTQAKCDITFWISGTTSSTSYFTTCSDVGGAGKSCTTPSYMYQSGSWYGTNFVTDEKEAFNLYFTADAIVLNWRYRGVSSGKLVGTDITVFTTEIPAFKQFVNPSPPPAEAALTTAKAAATLNTAQILAKFFTKDNIALAQMQGSTVSVKTTIGAYKATAIKRQCDKGQCGAWAVLDLNAPAPSPTAGGEGTVILACSVPKDLTQSKCDVTFWISGTTSSTSYFTTCSDIGGATKSCTTPSYMYQSGSWYGTNFVTDEKEVYGVYFTNDALVMNWRYRGVSSGKLVFTDITLQTTTPFKDFNTPPKTNCLSKTTTADVMAAAAAKLKNKVTLTTVAVDALIKGAPYKTVADAVSKIKGIGPINVVYVSFMWNFEC